MFQFTSFLSFEETVFVYTKFVMICIYDITFTEKYYVKGWESTLKGTLNKGFCSTSLS